ncbi:MAG: DUF721 domain-containing protein [Acidobacteria bacterium]|nr:MAG: DUF721 domain-containing protein [Acidobacteriota bacterium]
MKAVSSLLPGFLRQVAKDETAAFACLCEFWPRIVGQQLASRTSPLQLNRRHLILAVPSESWQDELAGMTAMLIESVNNFWQMRLIERISLKVHQSD